MNNQVKADCKYKQVSWQVLQSIRDDGSVNQASVKKYQDINGRKPQRIRKDSITAAIVVPCPQRSDQVFFSVQPELFHAEFPSLGDFLAGNSHPKTSMLYCAYQQWHQGTFSLNALFLLLLPVKAARGSCVFCCQQCHVLGMLRVWLLTQGAGKPTQ